MDKGTTNKKGRGIWSDEENKTLIELVQGKKRLSWNEVAIQLSQKCGTSKTGKQCRERFRNYANPALEKSEWKAHEKLLFLVLHRTYGNQWSAIAKHLNQRSDVVVKNYFYSITRKAMKHFRGHSIPASLLKKPEKFYLVFSVLLHIRAHYLPALKDLHLLPKYSHKEKIILNLLRQHNVTDDSIKEYQDMMIEKFRKSWGDSPLPVILTLSLKDFNFAPSKAEELAANPEIYNSAPLNQVVKVVVQSGVEPEKKSPPTATVATPTTTSPAATTLVGRPVTDPMNYFCWNQVMDPMYYVQNPYLPAPFPIASIQSMQAVQIFQPPQMAFVPPVRPMAIRPTPIHKTSSGILSPGIHTSGQHSPIPDPLSLLEPARKMKRQDRMDG